MHLQVSQPCLFLLRLGVREKVRERDKESERETETKRGTETQRREQD